MSQPQDPSAPQGGGNPYAPKGGGNPYAPQGGGNPYAPQGASAPGPINPYQPPQAENVEVYYRPSTARDFEAIRRDHIKHEASLKSLGCLHLFGGILTGIAALGGLFAALGAAGGAARGGVAGPNPAFAIGFTVGVVAVYGGLSLAQLASAYGLRTLSPWTKVPTGILCAFGLLGFPIGTILCAYFLWLVFSAKGQYILSDEYKDVIAQTPHVKYVSWLAWILLVLILLAGLGLVVGAVAG